MKNLIQNPYRILGIFSVVLSAVSIGWSVEYNLRADVTTVTIPNGTPLGDTVTMWGFALDAGPVTIPGPLLRVPDGDTTLTIHLTNNLTPAATGIPMGCPASVVIPGQVTALSPVRFGPMPYPQFEGRLRNITYDTPPGGTMDYTWTDLKPGSYTYLSGNHLACHVQMGLYGAMVKDAAVGQAYPGVEYDNEVILFYSEIDTAFHTAVATLNYGPGKAMTSTMGYDPQYFLVNGQPYQAGQLPFPAGLAGERTLIRFFNMGLETHVPVFQNLRATVLAEDGYPYQYSKDQSSIMLPAGKTVDAIVIPQTAGLYPVYDRRLRLTNQTASPGGLLSFLEVGAPAGNIAPVISSVSATPSMIFDTQTSQLLVEATDTDGPAPLSYAWTVPVGAGSVNDPSIANPTYSPPDLPPGSPDQMYTISVTVSDGLGAFSTSSVDVTVQDVAHIAPQISAVTATPATIFDSQTSQLLVEATDTDGPAPLSYAWTVPAGAGTLSNATIANPIYTPPNVTGLQTYTLGVQVSDGQDTVSGSVTIDVYDSVILSADFASSAQGFVYADNLFNGTNQPAFANGAWFSAGYLMMSVGGVNTVDVTGMSGGFRRTFTVPPASGSMGLSIRYMMSQAPGLEPSEYTQVLVSLDGVLLGTGANNYVAQIVGNGDGGSFMSTGLQWFNKNLGTLAPGNHTLIIGGFMNHKNAADELAVNRFEDVILTVTGP